VVLTSLKININRQLTSSKHIRQFIIVRAISTAVSSTRCGVVHGSRFAMGIAAGAISHLPSARPPVASTDVSAACPAQSCKRLLRFGDVCRCQSFARFFLRRLLSLVDRLPVQNPRAEGDPIAPDRLTYRNMSDALTGAGQPGRPD
jgi:hypothetical protein